MVKQVENIVIRFAGDSGDGMQITGTQFTNTSALQGNDVHTFPDFPAEIRAPAGTLPGVSGFQLHFSSQPIHTSGDKIDVLVAMNPAALKVNLRDLKADGILLVNTDNFTERELKKANYLQNPLENDDLKSYRLHSIPITDLTLKALADFDLSHSQARKCKNMYALGLIYWLYDKSLDNTCQWIADKFKKEPTLVAANTAVLKAGYHYADTTELFSERYQVAPAALPEGEYRQITGNEALALGCVAVAYKSTLPMLLAGYPITPASAVLHEMVHYQHLGIKVFQAEDEIAAIGAALGASYGGGIGFTCTSGPGFDLKSEMMGLAMITELPLVIIDVQRAGPSTGMPTKTEQTDLLTAMYGRHGECPIPILAPRSPNDCFEVMFEAFRIALKYMTPVIVLSDGAIANGAEPWLLPDVDALPNLQPKFHQTVEDFSPYKRDPKTLARPWAKPGTPGLEHRIGGIEKADVTGNVSYDPENHQKMVDLRAKKIAGIADDYPELEIIGKKTGKLLVVGWGSTYGAILTAIEELQQQDLEISALHLRHLFPLPKQLKTYLQAFTHILIPELNSGHLARLIRAEFLVDVMSLPKITGKPFLVLEIKNEILKMYGDDNHEIPAFAGMTPLSCHPRESGDLLDKHKISASIGIAAHE